jgi:5'-phosphate synthase pdxT subunit
LLDGLAAFGTCAGMVLLAKEVVGPAPATLGVMDLTVRRNAYGRQVDSFEVDLEAPVLGPEPLRAVFIRAPWVERVGEGVEVLVAFRGQPVLVRQGRWLASAFHPELTPDLRLHQYFLKMVAGEN